jgi:hypothetical protein
VAAYEVLLLNTAIPQIQAAQSGDTYVVPRDIAINATAIISANSATDALRITQTGAGNAILVEDSANPDSTPFVVDAAGNVGIGTTSPSSYLSGTAKLVAYANANSQNNILLRNDSNGASSSSAIVLNAAGNTWGIEIGSAAKNNNALTFQLDYGGTNSTKMTLDASGNLGLGVTSLSPWVSVVKVLQIGAVGGTVIGGNTSAGGTSFFGQNYYYDTSYKFETANAATYYAQTAGQHQWWRSTATPVIGNDPVFSQAMTLDADGDLGIGTTSPAVRLHVLSSGSEVTRFATSGADMYLRFVNSFDSNGYIGYQNAAMTFWTANTERARITSGGEVLFGLNAQTNTPANGFVFQNLGTTSSQVLIGHSNGSGSGTYYEAYFYDSTVIGSVTQNGTTGVLYNITSDYRLKTVTGPVTDAGSRIDALEPVEYTWKANGASARGFLAHKFQEVYPNSVTGQKDAVDAEGNPVYQNMQASTSEVIADLVAELQSLRARVAQLEAK